MPFVRRDAVDLYYEEDVPGPAQDAGPAVVLVHGLGGCVETWQEQREMLAAKGCRVVALDLRGHGRSSKPPGPYSIPLFADDVAHVVRSLGIQPCTVAGHSLGGVVGYELAVRYPELVRSLIVVNSFSEVRLKRLGWALLYLYRIGVIGLLGLQTWGGLLAKQLFPGEEGRACRERFRGLYRWNRRAPYLSALQALVGYSVSARLGEIRCPVLIVSADRDYIPVEEKRRDLEAIPGARLEIVADSGHFILWDKPRELGALMSDFALSPGS